MIKLIKDIWFTRRDIISDGFDKSLEYISKIIPLKIHRISTGKKCWTWTIPEKWNVLDAYISDMSGKKLLDLKEHPLHIISYSLPINKIVSKEELLKHLHTNPKMPDAIPFQFKYYQKDWGFCIQHNRLVEFKDEKYKVFIDSSFEKGNLAVGECEIKGESDDTIVIVAHLCHPAMVNDDLAGVAVTVDVAKELLKRKNKYSYKLLFVPETIGSIAYLSQNEDVIPKLKYGMFLEMLGTRTEHSLQHSRQGETKIDRVARFVLKKHGKKFNEGDFRKIIGNDEMVFNGPGVDVPMVSLSRYPYAEYHTSFDNPGIISEESLEESKQIVMKIINILESDYTPKRLFKGPVFLSGYGLWVDWRVNKKLNENIDQIMLSLEGDKSVFDIAYSLDMNFEDVLHYIDSFLKNNLVKKL